MIRRLGGFEEPRSGGKMKEQERKETKERKGKLERGEKKKERGRKERAEKKTRKVEEITGNREGKNRTQTI